MAKGVDIPVDQIKPSPYQPRLTFDLEDIKGSIMRDGILVTLTVRKKDGYYELVDGERRWRVAKELGYKTVPCDVIEIDDDTARRMVWKVNTLRKDYEPKEKALFFKKMQEKYGMSIRGIAREYDQDHHTVIAYLNVFKLPDDYQQMVWDRVIPISVIRELEPLFSSGEYSPEGKLSPEANPQIFGIVDRAARIKGFGARETREVLKPYLAKLREEEIGKAREALEKVQPEVKALETPEELEEAARVLMEEAKKRKTPEQILEEKRDKARGALLMGKGNIQSKIEKAKELGIDVAEFEERFNELKVKIEDDPDEALKGAKQLRADLNKTIKAFEEKEKRRRLEEDLREKIEKEVEERTVRKMLTTPEYIEVAKSLPTPIVKPAEVTIPPEEAEAIRRRYEELKERIDKIVQLPEVKARGVLFRNWYSHYLIAQGVVDAFCPACGKEKSGKLVWNCCELDAKEALKLAGERFERSQRA